MTLQLSEKLSGSLTDFVNRSAVFISYIIEGRFKWS